MMAIVPLCHYMPSVTEIVLMLVFLIAGASRAYNFVPFLIANQYFDGKGEDKGKLQAWQTVVDLGDVLALVFMSLFLYTFKLSW